MKRLPVLLFFLLASILCATAQEKWNLERCVTYAMANNISVKRSDVLSRISALTLEANRAGQFPSLSFGTSAGYNFGRSINPATNQFENEGIFFSNYQLQSNVNLFNWFSQRTAIEASRLDLQAAEAAVEKARNDIALNVCVAYLQTLLANEQVEISSIQIRGTSSQMDAIQKRVKAGALPELNLIEMEAQLARDSAAYIAAQSLYQQNLITLKALLNLDMTTPFDIEKPDVSAIPVEPMSELQPALVYAEALKNLPQQRVNSFRYQAALKSAASAKASMYPTLSAFANVGSRYSSAFPDQSNIVVTPTGNFDTLGAVEIAPGTIRYAVRPSYNVTTKNLAYGRQVFDVNMSQAIGLNLSVPIFNGKQLRTNWKRAKLNAEDIRLQLDQDNLTLQSDIYNAYTNAVNAQQRYASAMKAVEATAKAYEFSNKRFGVGLLSTFELITNQYNNYRAQVDAASAQFEYIFRMKLLEFYKGRGLKL